MQLAHPSGTSPDPLQLPNLLGSFYWLVMAYPVAGVSHDHTLTPFCGQGLLADRQAGPAYHDYHNDQPGAGGHSRQAPPAYRPGQAGKQHRERPARRPGQPSNNGINMTLPAF